MIILAVRIEKVCELVSSEFIIRRGLKSDKKRVDLQGDIVRS